MTEETDNRLDKIVVTNRVKIDSDGTIANTVVTDMETGNPVPRCHRVCFTADANENISADISCWLPHVHVITGVGEQVFRVPENIAGLTFISGTKRMRFVEDERQPPPKPIDFHPEPPTNADTFAGLPFRLEWAAKRLDEAYDEYDKAYDACVAAKTANIDIKYYLSDERPG